MIKAAIIADSVSPLGQRLTSLELTFHRFILAEFNKHRKFTNSAASSRAIPFVTTLKQVMVDPAIPLRFPHEQPGMSGGDEVNMSNEAKQLWLVGRTRAADVAIQMSDLKVHKSVVNRLIEPYMWISMIVTSTEWDNFFNQRIAGGVQPEMEELAKQMRAALQASAPTAVDYREWHLPYLTEAELNPYRSDLNDEARRQLSVARCAGVSYNRLGKIREMAKDFALYERLLNASPPHWTPFEHVATPASNPRKRPKGNFDGWHQLRHILTRNGKVY